MEASNFESIFECISYGVNKVLVLVLVLVHTTRKDDKGDHPRRPRQILEQHDLAKDSAGQANLETA